MKNFDHLILNSESHYADTEVSCGRCGCEWEAPCHVEYGSGEILDPECPDCGWDELDDCPTPEDHLGWILDKIKEVQPSQKVCEEIASWYELKAKTPDELIGVYLTYARAQQNPDGWGFDDLTEDARYIYDS